MTTVLDRFRLDDKVAIVTGASSGLGVAFAKALAESATLPAAAQSAEPEIEHYVRAMRLHCAEVSSLGQPTDVKVLFIDVRVEGFLLERFNDRGELVGTTQHDTMDEAMWQASSEYEISDWRSCPEDVDPVEYLRAHPRRDSDTTVRDG
jgi:hypothetical protein